MLREREKLEIGFQRAKRYRTTRRCEFKRCSRIEPLFSINWYLHDGHAYGRAIRVVNRKGVEVNMAVKSSGHYVVNALRGRLVRCREC
jgi:hypothetical protein